MEHITSRTNPLISLVRRLRDDRKTRRREGLFLCDGVKMLEEAIKWKAPLQTVLLSEDLADTPVPGGVGPMTRAMLMENTLTAARLHGKE